ncbi:MAG: sulfurtransferase TusA family protein [Oscillospiraceae bacterium]|jgi:TusA-related sulfurtransferase|nr:sulfurtransferase TusA family protein [Oscillospiraceae bacterium]
MKVRDLDCLYEVCPIPLIKAVKELKKMNSGDVLVVHSDESCVGVMMEEWAKQNHYSIQIEEPKDGEWEIYLQKP